jgi:O-6-methylguanine DNA methyltransferase
MRKSQQYYEVMVSPIGDMLAIANETGLQRLEFCDQEHLTNKLLGIEKNGVSKTTGGSAVLSQLKREMDAYFSGELKEFSIPLEPSGTAFQQQVWKQLLKIPYAKTSTYGEQAAAMGNPLVIRAMASANGKNPIAVVIPCHRVIGADGSLTGYAGGLWRKQWLLAHEGVLAKQSTLF